MTTYRTGNHHGVTICVEGDGQRCARPDHDCARGHIVAVVVNGDRELAERIAWLLTHACPTCMGPQRETVGMVCQTCGTDYAAASRDADGPSGRSLPPQGAQNGSGVGRDGMEAPGRSEGRFWGEHPAHPTCVDVTTFGQPPGSEWKCGPDCPIADGGGIGASIVILDEPEGADRTKAAVDLMAALRDSLTAARARREGA